MSDGELALATTSEALPDFMKDDAPDAGRLKNEEGLFQVPFLKILQGLSNEVSARAGMIGDIWSQAHEKALGGPNKPAHLIPVSVQRNWTLFDGKQFLWRANSEDDASTRLAESLRQKPDLKVKEVWQTSRLQVMVLAPVLPDYHDMRPMVLSFHGKAHKIGATWYKAFTNRSAVKFNAPFYGQVWALSAVSTKNDQGDWFIPMLSFAGLIKTKDVFIAAKNMFDHFENERWSGTEDSAE